MEKITITKQSDNTYLALIGEDTFEVTARPEYIKEVFGENSPAPTDIVRASFEFLLEREPQSQIMKTFDLSVIETYFPEYRAEIVKTAL